MTENIKDNKSANTAVRLEGKGINIAIIVCAVIAALGIALWFVQLTQGLIVTSMRDLSSWGLYITMFMFFVGLSAGGLIISSVPKAFGVQGFGGISKVAIWSSVCCTILAVAFVVVDLGHPLKIWELFIFSNLNSPLMWDILVLSIYLVLSIGYLWATLRAEAGKISHKAMRIISVASLICAIMVHSVTAWIFGLQAGREFWHTALLAPWFVSSALVCGTALVLIIVLALSKTNYLKVESSNIVKLTKLLGVFIVVDLYFFGCDLLTEGFPGGHGMEVVNMLTTGVLAPFFWFEIIGCAIAAVICFTDKLRTNKLIVCASIISILGIFCKRVQLLVGGFQLPNIEQTMQLPAHSVIGWENGAALVYNQMVYWPSLLEFGISVGVLALGGLLLLLGLKYLPLK